MTTCGLYSTALTHKSDSIFTDSSEALNETELYGLVFLLTLSSGDISVKEKDSKSHNSAKMFSVVFLSGCGLLILRRKEVQRADVHS